MTSPGRVLVVGWDGACWPVLDPLLEEGRLPALAELLANGSRGDLQSTFPPVTPAAWTAMATGLSPGETGMLGFRELDLSRLSAFSPTLASSAGLQGRTLFEYAAASGAGVSLVGWPMTWPAFPIEGGVLVSGWPRPRTRRAPTWPPELGATLGDWGAGDVLPRLGRPSLEQQVESASWWDRRHTEVACRLLRERDDRLVAVVLSGTDHLSHVLWDQPALADHFAEADAHLAALLEAAGAGTSVLLVSDHGFGPAPTRELHLNRWLAEQGWLHWRPEEEAEGEGPGTLGRLLGGIRHGLPRKMWAELRDRLPPGLRRWGYERSVGIGRIDADQTRAFQVPLYEGFAGVCVREGHEGLVPALTEALVGLPPVVGAWPREELFQGSRMECIPHVLVEFEEDITLGSGSGAGPLLTDRSSSEIEAWPATHRTEGVFVASGPGLRSDCSPESPHVLDVGLTAIALAGLPVPDGRHGRVLQELLEEPVRWIEEAVSGGPSGDGDGDGAGQAPGLERELRRLGYVR